MYSSPKNCINSYFTLVWVRKVEKSKFPGCVFHPWWYPASGLEEQDCVSCRALLCWGQQWRCSATALRIRPHMRLWQTSNFGEPVSVCNAVLNGFCDWNQYIVKDNNDVKEKKTDKKEYVQVNFFLSLPRHHHAEEDTLFLWICCHFVWLNKGNHLLYTL